MADADSLYFNLTQCLHALRKLCDSNRLLPSVVSANLRRIEDAIVLCQCACVDEEARSASMSAMRQTYVYVLNTLLTACNNSSHALLQLYFRKTIHWQLYHLNITEIVYLLDGFLCHRELSGGGGGGNNRYENFDPNDRLTFRREVRFRRKFLPLVKLSVRRPRVADA